MQSEGRGLLPGLAMGGTEAQIPSCPSSLFFLEKERKPPCVGIVKEQGENSRDARGKKVKFKFSDIEVMGYFSLTKNPKVNDCFKISISQGYRIDSQLGQQQQYLRKKLS